MLAYLQLARRTQRFTFERLGYLGGAADCAGAPYLSYRRSDREPEWSDLWYNATQLGADAELLAADPSFDRCTLDKAALFLDRYWDPADGGFLARGRPDGSGMLRPDKYSDDHAHLGLMLLEAYRATDDPRFLAQAERAARFLLNSALWDSTFGGGFWWNSRRGDTAEGKPAQANGLAATLLLRLYGLTGRELYRTWGERTLAWLDACLFDGATGLYRWSISYADLQRRRGERRADRFFNYDQGIVIEAKLARYHHVAPDPADLAAARALAERLEPWFWHPGEGGFNLEAGVEQVFAVYSAWLTAPLLWLYRTDGDERWVALARRNIEAMHAYLSIPGGGYWCSARLAGGRWTIDPTIDTAANAGMQRALALLAQTTAPAPPA